MIDISTKLAFASFDEESKQLTSSLIDIDENTSLISNADEPKVNNHVCYCADYNALVTKLTGYGVKNPDGTDLAGGVI